jgi:hypothetical protein
MALSGSADAYKNTLGGSFTESTIFFRKLRRLRVRIRRESPGPDSVEGRAAAAGRLIPGMPEAGNITVVKSK